MAAEEKANVSYIEQLREMRATRIQQLRQGNEQKQQFSLMTRTLNSVVAATNTQTRVATQNLREQQAVVRQTREMSRDIRSLSSSITRSIGSLTSAIGRGVGGAASLAGRGVAATTGATVNLTSSIMSVLGRVLPVALVGVLGKAFLWDNLTPETKNKLTGAIGGMFLRIFDTLKPFFAKIGDTIKSIFQDLSVELNATFAGMSAVMGRAMGDLTSSFEKSLGPLKTTFKSVEELAGTADRFIDKLTPNFSVGNLNVGDVITGTGVLLAGKGAYDAVKGGTVPSNISKAAGGRVIVITKDVKSTFDFIAKHGLPNKTESIVGARIIVEAEKAGARNFLKFVYDHKVLNVIGIIVPVGIYLWDLSHIEQILSQLERENLITPQEKEYFLSTGKYISASGLAGSALLSVLAGYAANRIGAGSTATTVSSFLGAGAGTKMGEYVGKPLHQVAEFFGVAPKRPESLDKEVIKGTSTVERLKELERQRTGGTPQASEVVPNRDSSGIDINDPDIRKILNRGEREGIRQNPYQSAEGREPTIGIGHKLTPDEVKAGGVFIDGKLVPLDLRNVKDQSVSEQGPKQLTKEQVMKLYEQDHKKHFGYARNFIGADVFDKLTKDQQLALADMSFMNPSSLTPQLKQMVISGNVQGVAKYMENWGQYYVTESGDKKYSPHLQSSARGRAKLYAGPGGYSTGMMDSITSNLSNYSSVYMQAYRAAREQGYKELEQRRGEDAKEEKTKMKFFSEGAVQGLMGAFKDGSELKSNIVSDLRNMTSILGGPGEDKKEPAKNIVTNFNTTNVNNINGGGGGGSASINSVRPNNDLVTDFIKMAGT